MKKSVFNIAVLLSIIFGLSVFVAGDNAYADVCGDFYDGKNTVDYYASEDNGLAACIPDYVRDFFTKSELEGNYSACCVPISEGKTFRNQTAVWAVRKNSSPLSILEISASEIIGNSEIQLDLWSTRYTCDFDSDANVGVRNWCAGFLSEEENYIGAFEPKSLRIFPKHISDLGWAGKSDGHTDGMFDTDSDGTKLPHDGPLGYAGPSGSLGIPKINIIGHNRYCDGLPSTIDNSTFLSFNNPIGDSNDLYSYPSVKHGTNTENENTDGGGRYTGFRNIYDDTPTIDRISIKASALIKNCDTSAANKCQKIIVGGEQVLYKIPIGGLVEQDAGNIASSSCLNASNQQILIRVKMPFELTPSVTVNSNKAESGSVVEVKPVVSNDNSTTSTSDWVLSKTVFYPNNSTNYNAVKGKPITDNSLLPSVYLGSFNPNQYVELASGKQNFPQGTYEDFPISTDVMSYEIGTGVCYFLSVSPYDENSSGKWRHSVLTCVTIIKQPNAQVHGNTLFVPTGSVTGTTGIRNSFTYGSWIEYDILAKSNVNLVASNAGYLTGDSTKLNLLTFSNTPVLGNFSDSLSHDGAQKMADYFDKLTQAGTSIGSKLDSIPSDSTNYLRRNGALSIELSGNIVAGASAIVVVNNADITINKNIIYNNATTLNGIPQLVLVAKNGNIIINEGVTQVDAWLIAYTAGDSDIGHLKTCSNATPSLNTCNQKLVINGPVMVDYLDLRRTGGMNNADGTDGGVAAEVINFRPDAYMWAQNRASSKMILSTTYTRELPPRY